MDQDVTHLVGHSNRVTRGDDKDRSRNTTTRPQVIVVLEGVCDIRLLTAFSRLLHSTDRSNIDLADWETTGRLMFVPAGGMPDHWQDRLGPLGVPEFHLYDRERSPESNRRAQIVAAINARLDCVAALTTKRSLENYLHPDAICAAGGPKIACGDSDPVAERVAQARFEAAAPATIWEELRERTRKRMISRTKRWLATKAVHAMTVAQLAQRDPSGDLAGWLSAIERLATFRR